MKFPIPKNLKKSAHINSKQYEKMYAESTRHPDQFWAGLAEEFISWEKSWDSVSNCDFTNARVSWFEGAELNVCYNCIDRHLPERANQPALIWEGNFPGESRTITYQELLYEVCRLANLYRSLGVQAGDRIAIYLPMVPEAVFAMLACARIGAIHSVIFAGFSAHAIRDRLLDSEAKLLITANEGFRGDKVVPLKQIVDQALVDVNCVKNVIIVKRSEQEFAIQNGRDLIYQDVINNFPDYADYQVMSAEAPLFILYTSGSTGQPKGVLHTTGGYLLYTAVTHKYVFDYQDGDIFCCAADIGWITGHSYVVYGPLANGATTVLFESTPTYPTSERYWQLIEKLKINIFYTAPTAIRAVAKEAPNGPDLYDLSSLKVIGSVGEPINKEAWLWYYEKVGRSQCALVDTWWQTETGGILISALPGAIATKPGSVSRPFFGVQPLILDPNNEIIQTPMEKGRLFIAGSWPGQMRTVYRDHARFQQTYFSQAEGLYFSGDAAYFDDDGFYWITGRVDDVINVSGHRIGTAEVESAIIFSGIVAEAAVVAVEHEIKGQAIIAFCILKDCLVEGAEKLVKDAVRAEIGAFAQPEKVCFVPGLPKTRSGKIMRRILRKIASGETKDIGDITTLADPAVIDEIINIFK